MLPMLPGAVVDFPPLADSGPRTACLQSSSLQADIEVKSSSIDRMAKQLAAQMDR